jgi:hypothetical protein
LLSTPQPPTAERAAWNFGGSRKSIGTEVLLVDLARSRRLQGKNIAHF